MTRDDMTLEEYLSIREDVACFLEEKRKNNVTAFDKLPSDKHRKIVFDNATAVYEKSKLIEPAISRDLASLVPLIGGELRSFENRIKSMESLKRKIISDSIDYEGSYLRAAYNLCDGVRYTLVIDDSIYILKVNEYLHKIEELGYEVIDFKNNWGKELYQGINVRICCPNGKDIFELQFHTPYGYHIKEKSTRDLYQVVRDDSVTDDDLNLKTRANKLRRFLQKSVSIPTGSLEYFFDSEIKRR